MGSYFPSASMIPGAGTALNLNWLAPTAAGLNPDQVRKFGMLNGGDPGTIYDQMAMNKNIQKMADYNKNVRPGQQNFDFANTAFQSTAENGAQKIVGGSGAKGGVMPTRYSVPPAGKGGTSEDLKNQLGIGAGSPIQQKRTLLRQQNPQADYQFPELFRASIPIDYTLKQGLNRTAISQRKPGDLGQPFQNTAQNNSVLNDPYHNPYLNRLQQYGQR